MSKLRKKDLLKDIVQLQKEVFGNGYCRSLREKIDAACEILVDENDSNLREEVKDLRAAIDGLAEEFRETEKASFYELGQLHKTVAQLEEKFRWLDNHRPVLEQIIQDYRRKCGEYVEPGRQPKRETSLADLPPKDKSNKPAVSPAFLEKVNDQLRRESES